MDFLGFVCFLVIVTVIGAIFGASLELGSLFGSGIFKYLFA